MPLQEAIQSIQKMSPEDLLKTLSAVIKELTIAVEVEEITTGQWPYPQPTVEEDFMNILDVTIPAIKKHLNRHEGRYSPIAFDQTGMRLP